jgi:hypothetical protein
MLKVHVKMSENFTIISAHAHQFKKALLTLALMSGFLLRLVMFGFNTIFSRCRFLVPFSS